MSPKKHPALNNKHPASQAPTIRLASLIYSNKQQSKLSLTNEQRNQILKKKKK